MSRGLGALQRAVLDRLGRSDRPYTIAIELAAAIEGRDDNTVSHAGVVSLRRALYGLEDRGLVRLGLQGLHAWRSQVLIVWLPSQPGPSPYNGRPSFQPLRRKRCQVRTIAHLATLTGGDS